MGREPGIPVLHNDGCAKAADALENSLQNHRIHGGAEKYLETRLCVGNKVLHLPSAIPSTGL